MKKRYEALLALSTRGKEESVKEIIERLEKTIAGEGATIEQVQRFEKRDLAYQLQAPQQRLLCQLHLRSRFAAYRQAARQIEAGRRRRSAELSTPASETTDD